MALRIGGSTPTALRVGATEATKAYLGSTLVYEKAAGGAFDPLVIPWHTVFHADSLTGLADGDPIATWNDGSGNGRTASQATSAKQPVYRPAAATLNGKPAAEFDTVDDSLITAAFTEVLQTYTVVVIGSVGSLSGSRNLAYLRPTNAAPYTSVYTDGTVFRAYSGVSLSSGVAATTSPNLVRAYFNGTSSSITVGATGATGSAGTGGANAVDLNSNAGAANFGGGLRAFVGLFVGDITTDPNWAAFKTWANTTYGVTA